MEGQIVQNPLPEIRLFSLCEGMKWAHLPVGGGIYDQDPGLLDRWRVMFSMRAQHEAEKAERERQQAPRQRQSRKRH